MSADGRENVTSFQPMCGIFRPGASSRVTVPASSPSPSAPSCSVEAAKSSCMPRQMPSTGTPASARSRSSSTSPSPWRRRIASGNAPTPGSTIASAPAIVSRSAVRATRAPTCSSAFSTLRRLPIP